MNTEKKISHEIAFDNASVGKSIDLPSLPGRDQPIRILVIKLRHFGDVLLTTPLINTLKTNYPHALIDVLVYGGTEVMLAGNKAVYLTYTVDRALKKQGLKKQFRGEKALLNSLGVGHYDIILNLSDQWRAAFYCYKLNPTLSIGFRYPKRNNRLWRFFHSTLVDTESQPSLHTVMNNLSILEPLALAVLRTDVTMSYRQMDIDHLELLCPKTSFTDYIVIQPTARWAFKNWSTDSYSQLINYLMRHGEKVVITGGRSEGEISSIRQILNGCIYSKEIINLAGKLDIPELAVLIDRAKLFIGVDSAPMPWLPRCKPLLSYCSVLATSNNGIPGRLPTPFYGLGIIAPYRPPMTLIPIRPSAISMQSRLPMSLLPLPSVWMRLNTPRRQKNLTAIHLK